MSRDVKRDGTRRRFSESLVCSPVRAGKRDPAYPSKITPWGHFWKPALEDLPLAERKKRSFLRSGGRPPSKLSRLVPKTRGRPLISVGRIVPALVRRFDERTVVAATALGPDGEEICDFDSRALHGRIAPTKTSSSSLRPPDRDVPGELRAAGGATGRARQEICSEMRFDTLV